MTFYFHDKKIIVNDVSKMSLPLDERICDSGDDEHGKDSSVDGRKQHVGYAVYSTWCEFIGEDDEAGQLIPCEIFDTKKEAWDAVYLYTDECFSSIKLTWSGKLYHRYNNFRARLHMKTRHPGMSLSDCECWVTKIEYWK